MSLIDDEQSSVLRAKLLQAFKKTRFWEHDAYVGQSGFRQQTSDITIGQRLFYAIKIIELRHSSSDIEWNGCTDISFTRNHTAIAKRGKGFIDTAVVAAVKDQNFLTTSDQSCITNCVTIGIGSGEGELPQWQSKATREFC